MIFLDASALVAMIAQEPEASALVLRLDADARRIHSPMAYWEAMAALHRSYGLGPSDARNTLDEFLSTVNSQLVPIGSKEAQIAAEAYELYGRGRHPAALNMGDCFAYACAKNAGARHLYKGNDFALTDLA